MRQRVASVVREQQIAVGLATDTCIVKPEQQPVKALNHDACLTRTVGDLDDDRPRWNVGEALEQSGVSLHRAYRPPLSNDAISSDHEVRVTKAQPSLSAGTIVSLGDDKDRIRFALHPAGVLFEIDGLLVLGVVLDVVPAEAVHAVVPIQLQFRGLRVVVRHGFLPYKPDRIVADVTENGSLDFGVGAVAGYFKLGGVQ